MNFFRGANKPLLEVLPPAKDTLGEYAIDLSSKAGLILDPWQCDAVNAMMSIRDDGKWSCREYAEIVARQNGKGAILEARILAGLFLLDEKLIMYSAHQFKTSSRAFRRIRALIRNLERDGHVQPGEIKIKSGHGEESIEIIDTEQQVLFIARSKDSGRGFSGECNMIDEAYGYTDMQDEAVRPTMSAMANPQMIYTSTPPLSGDTGTVLYRIRRRALSGDSSGLGYRDWTSLPPDITLDDIDSRENGKPVVDHMDKELWKLANPAAGYREGLTEEWILGEAKAMGKAGFVRERMGIWPREILGVGGAIDMTKWYDLLDPDSRREGQCAVGIDIAPNRKHSAVGLYGEGSNGIDHMRLVKYAPGTSWIVAGMALIRSEINPIAWGMQRATFASLKSELRDNGFAPPEKPGEFKHGDILVLDGSEAAAACGLVLDGIQDASFRIRPDLINPEVLNSAANGAELRMGIDNVAWSRRGKDDITPLEAVTNALWAYTSQRNNLHQKPVFFGAWR
jgi:phage terminase large subunit-like protein